MIDKKAVGARIKEARELKGYTSMEAVATKLRELIDSKSSPAGNKEKPSVLSRQTVANWESGKNCPPWDMVEYLAVLFAPEYDEERIMFGTRRSQQLMQGHSVLARLTDDEIGLLQVYREANDQGKKGIVASARGIAGEHPAHEATLYPLRRQTDPAH